MMSLRRLLMAAACGALFLNPDVYGHGRIHRIDDVLAGTDLCVIAIPTGHQATIDGRNAGTRELCDVMQVISPVLSRGATLDEGDELMMYRAQIQGDMIQSAGHVPALEIGRPYLLLLQERDQVAGSWDIVAGGQGAFRLVSDEGGSGEIYPMRFDRRGITGLGENGMLELTPNLDAVVDGLAIPAGDLDALMSPSPIATGEGAVSATTRTPWLGGGILSLNDLIRMLSEIDQGDASALSMHDHGVDGPIPSLEAGAMSDRGGVVDLCVCNRWELTLLIDALPEDFWAFGKDMHSMWTYNQFMDIYRYYIDPGWAGGNGDNEFGGFTSNANMQDQYNGYSWGTDTLGVTQFWIPSGCDCCWFVETDVHYNPRFSWQDDIDDTLHLFDSDDRALYRPVLAHELGHTWGYQSEGSTGSACPETYNYDRHSVMHAYYDDVIETGKGLHLADAMLIRAGYSDQTSIQALIDVGCESYYVDSTGQLAPSYFYPVCPDADEVVTLYDVVMENMTRGWNLHDVELRIYLSKNNHTITESDRLVATWTWSDLSSETWWQGDLSFVWPNDLDPDIYYIGLMMYLPQDEYTQVDFYSSNNTTWMEIPCPGNPTPDVPTCGTPTIVDIIPWDFYTDVIWIPNPFWLDDNDPPMELCCSPGGMFYGPDLWYEVTPIANGMLNITLDGDAASDVIALYEADAACSGESPIACTCETGSSGGGNPAFGGQGEYVSLQAPVSADKRYLIRVGSLTGEPGGGYLNIGYRLEGIPGDSVALALPISGIIYGSLYDNTYQSGPEGACSPNKPVAEWYTWVSPANGTAWASTCDMSTSFDTAIAIFKADDCPDCSPIACNENADPPCGEVGASYVTWEVGRDQKYLIRVAGGNGDGDFVLRAGVHAAQPDNDSCSGMAVVSEGVTPFSTLGATEDAVSGCAGDKTNGVWFKYAPVYEGFVTVSTCEDDGGRADYDSVVMAVQQDQCDEVLRCGSACGEHGSRFSMWVRPDSYPLLVGGAPLMDGSESGRGDLAISLDVRCIGDIDGSGDVGIDDLLLLIGGWEGVDPLLDFSNDGTVGIDDLLAMLDHFGCTSNGL
ncbi:MAG: hypothetical protein GY894_08200 [Planctomycetes bacterium]|nr:hypothetical protein [Planctomycetota bacterium]MCP4839328.1 hypothetical protein [Planctomycetota bacterium]